MKNILLYTLLLTVAISYGQGMLSGEKVKKKPPTQQTTPQAKEYDFVGAYSEGLATVSFNGKTGFIDETGKEVIPTKYRHAESFSEGLALVLFEGK